MCDARTSHKPAADTTRPALQAVQNEVGHDTVPDAENGQTQVSEANGGDNNLQTAEDLDADSQVRSLISRQKHTGQTGQPLNM